MTVLILDDGLAKKSHPKFGTGVLGAGRNRSEDLYEDLVSRGVDTLLYDGRGSDEKEELLDSDQAARELLRRVRQKYGITPLSIRRVIVWSVRVGSDEIDHFCKKYQVSEDDILDRGKASYQVVANKILSNMSLPNIGESKSVDIVLDLIWFGHPDFGEAMLGFLI